MDKIIYLIAAERNMTEGAVRSNGGLFVNVGETSRTLRERLSDQDYSRKQMGGELKTIKTWTVPYNFSDKSIHKFLKSREDVIWENGKNTEEFLFVNDDGSGKKAAEIIEKIIETIVSPDFILQKLRHLEKSRNFSIESLIKENEEIQKENRELKSRVFTNSTRLEALYRIRDSLNQKLENNEKTLSDYLRQIDHLHQRLAFNKKHIAIKEGEIKQAISETTFYRNMFFFSIFVFVLACFYSYSLFGEVKERDTEIANLNEKMNSQSIEIKQLSLALDQQRESTDKYYILAHQALFDPSSIPLTQKNEMCKTTQFFRENEDPIWSETGNLKINCK